ncbi:MAG: Fic family protein [Chloroflexota bacterium]
MSLQETFTTIDALKAKIDTLPTPPTVKSQRLKQTVRIEWNYHSNALEGNLLTLGETQAFLRHDLTAEGKPFRHYLNIKGHNEAILYLDMLLQQSRPLTQKDILTLHQIMLVEPYEMPMMRLDGTSTQRQVGLGRYKTTPNHSQTKTGEIHFYTSPEETPVQMNDLMAWYHQTIQAQTVHPVILAATFHYRFLAIHPFDDGNGRLARLLLNFILMQHGYQPVIIKVETKDRYLLTLEQAEVDETDPLFSFIGQALHDSLTRHLGAIESEEKPAHPQTADPSAVPNKSTGSNIQKRQKHLFDFIIQPFLQDLLTKVADLKPHFDQAALSMYYVLAPNHTIVTVGVDETMPHLLNKLTKAIHSQAKISQIIVTYQFLHLSEAKPLDLKLHLNFKLTETGFVVRYALGQFELFSWVSKMVELIQGKDPQSYETKEIEASVTLIVNKLHYLIEQLNPGP